MAREVFVISVPKPCNVGYDKKWQHEAYGIAKAFEGRIITRSEIPELKRAIARAQEVEFTDSILPHPDEVTGPNWELYDKNKDSLENNLASLSIGIGANVIFYPIKGWWNGGSIKR